MITLDADRALVLLSGGQDSTTCLAWALDRFGLVETVGFDYRQRHRVELSCRRQILAALADGFPQWRSRLGQDHAVDLGGLAGLGDTAMTAEVGIAMAADGLPNTFVPGRNIIFASFAAALAYRRGIKNLVLGVCETDYSGYPDCRDDTVKALQVTLNLGMEARFVLHTPLMWIDKAATWEMARGLGGEALLEVIREHTHSCYVGDRTHRHPWGYGCGACPACELRKNGWEAFQAAGPGTAKGRP